MTKIEILTKAATSNEMSLITACKLHKIECDEDMVFTNELINRLTELKDGLPHGKGYDGMRLIRTRCINILLDKQEQYLTNNQKGE